MLGRERQRSRGGRAGGHSGFPAGPGGASDRSSPRPGRSPFEGPQAVLVAWMARVMSTFSPTRNLPPSSAWFHFTPNSLRLIEVVASAPSLVWPHGSVAVPRNSAARSTDLVMPLMVRSPVITWPSPVSRIEVLTKWSSPPLVGSKKSAERRWASRCSLWVVIDELLIVTSTEESRMFSAVVIVPAKSVKLPRTLLIRWRTEKPASECERSMFHVPARSPVCTSWLMRGGPFGGLVDVSTNDTLARHS